MGVLVLVVDDERDMRDLFLQQFRKDIRANRFAMDFAYSGAEALQKVGEATGLQIILILSDVNMPNMTGLELVPRLKKLRPDVPIIMVTAYGSDEMAREAAAAGAVGLLPKPIDFAHLRQEIDARLELR